ncbi:MAG: GNAT family N-acetyltransferase [Ignavibacteriales bacterium]
MYIENLYRNKGIGSNIINNIIKTNKLIYLWVYKDNKAINLYKKYDFKIIDETDSRYFMKRG